MGCLESKQKQRTAWKRLRTNKSGSADSDMYPLCQGINEFAQLLRNHLNKQDDNDLFSPISVHAFLTLISQDPWFFSKDHFMSSLYINVEASAKYRNFFKVLRDVNLRCLNTSFLEQHMEVLDTFKNRFLDSFVSELNSLDFTDQEGVTYAINSWFSERTAQKISGFTGLPKEVKGYFLNATHFEGDWTDPFAVEDTVSSTFYLNEQNTIQVQMMRKKGKFYCKDYPHLNAKVLKLSFAKSDVSLVIILPNKVVNIKEFEQEIFSPRLTQYMVQEELDVSLPKFKIEETLALSKSLKEMGLDELFTANLTGMINEEVLNCGEIHQKTFLEVKEAGSEAAGGTVSTVTKFHDEKVVPKDGLVVYEANISTDISNRFAKTKVVWRVKNTNTTAADAQFKVILTETAFITEFVMEIEGKSYKSYIKGKEEAQNIYRKAVKQGQSAGLVEAKTRDSREFTVSVNLEPDAVAVFLLTYEEMLQRLHDQYELVLNICPGQIVDDLSVEVRINETRPLKYVKTPPLRSGNDMNVSEFDKYLDPESDIKIINAKTATVKFRPDPAKQKRMAHYLECKISDGLTGQFVVQYDVEKEPRNGEVLLQDGYFVHFFAPNDVGPLPKHVVFVLDTSGSMEGREIEQLKDAMTNILCDLGKEDMLSIIEFNSELVVWDVDSKKKTMISDSQIKDFEEPFAYLQEFILANPQYVSDRILKNSKEIVKNIVANGGTFMIGGLETALYLVRTGQTKNEKDVKLQPIMVFLTDGQPNVGIQSTEQIVELVTRLNTKDKVPIFSLSFGGGADKDFLRKLSLKNLGFSRHIYAAADASLQLQDFYKQISSPLLRDITFKYDEEVEEVTRTWFPIYFRGSELVVAGRCGAPTLPISIDCCGPWGPITIGSYIERPVTSLERLWAYLTVKQLLDERDTATNPNELTKKATDLALKYSFVTDVTSLVVVKPKENETLSNQPVDDKSPTASFGEMRYHKSPTASFGEMRYHTSSTVLVGNTIIYKSPTASFGEKRYLSADTSNNSVMRRRCSSALHSGNMTLTEKDKMLMALSLAQNCSSSEPVPCSGLTLQCSDRSLAFQTSIRPMRRFMSRGCHLPNFRSGLSKRFARSELKADEEPTDTRKMSEKKFTVDRPFLVLLQVEKNDNTVILFQGSVSKPTY